MKAKNIIAIVVCSAIAIAMIICFNSSLRAAFLLPFDTERVIDDAEEIFSKYGIEDVSLHFEKTNIVKSMSHAYILVAELDETPEYSKLYQILDEMGELRFKESGNSNDPYVFICRCNIGDKQYSIYEDTLHESGEQVYPETKPYSPPSTTEAITEATTKSTFYRFSSGKKSSKKKSSHYDAEDYGNAEDFYDDHYDDFDCYEDAEAYYNEYN